MTTNQATYQVTEWGKPDEPMVTQFFNRGYYRNYLHWEIERWQYTDPKREAWVEENKEQVVLADGYIAEKGEAIAMFSWDRYRKPVEDLS